MDEVSKKNFNIINDSIKRQDSYNSVNDDKVRKLEQKVAVLEAQLAEVRSITMMLKAISMGTGATSN